MKLSIIINVYQSYEVVRRQLEYFKNMNLPDDIEIIIVDDGSCPAITGNGMNNLTIYYTNDKRPWTQGLARNAGVNIAKGKYILMTDVDHILSYEAIMNSYEFEGNKMIFPRYIAILDEEGKLIRDVDTLEEWGALVESNRFPYASYHGNTFCMLRETFLELGGYPEENCTYGFHAGSRKGEDVYFNATWNHWAVKQDIKPVVGSAIYIFPIGRYNKNYDLNPKGIFHNLSYEATPQPLKGE